LNEPPPVRVKRLAAPRLVLSLGISITPLLHTIERLRLDGRRYFFLGPSTITI
jgi:hypothetical protein